MTNEDTKGFTYLILDTNWWCFLAEGEHKSNLDRLKGKVQNSEIILLTPQTVLNEWENHKERVIKEIKDIIKKGLNTIEGVKHYLDDNDKASIERVIRNSQNKIEIDAEHRYQEVCNLIKSSKIIEVSDSVKLKAVDFALAKKAPFGAKNSMADALIAFSAIEFLRKEEYLGKDNAIFVSFNHLDFAKKASSNIQEEKEKAKNTINDDLKEEFESVGLKYQRHFYDAIELAEELKVKCEERLEKEYWDYLLGESEWQSEVERGR